MITPIEIQSKTFKSGGLGYDKKDVDGFFHEVQRSYEAVYRENMELTDKVNVLTEGIQYYKTIEKTLQKALVLAEKTAEDTRIAAEEKAKNIEREARSRSQMIVADAKNELERVHNQTIQLIQQYEKYKVQFKKLAEAQMELIESEPFNISVARLDSFIPVDEEVGAKKEGSKPVKEALDSKEDVEINATNPKPSRNVDLSGKVPSPEEFDAEESMEEVAATVATEEKKYSKDDFDVEFDTSFMDSYSEEEKKSAVDSEEYYDEDEDEEKINTHEKRKKHKKDKHDFSFFRLSDEED